MPLSAICRIAIVALFSCAIAACQTAPATNGAGYTFVKFSDPQAARLASQDETAGPAINSNNRQCSQDAACRK
ncbi:conserved exported hypothetical protein [Agrobacterium deltaense Zutra 3/1]|uniref:Lipoprotein n=1 Tax=Agrobacterium deltaense Zutra 3/1 TaxID=1183427 RepID=A0A1S7QQT8_9HYPH|nr:conserved exported hypothetical protein [Agrobacterium deltaense Zutra 3/1]